LHPQAGIAKGAVPNITRPRGTKTLNGIANYNRKVELKGTLLPEFSRSKHIEKRFKGCVLPNHQTNTDVILGNDSLTAVDMNCDGTDQTVVWLDNSTPCKPVGLIKSNKCMLTFSILYLRMKKLMTMTKATHHKS
jgi:hypothetical protein